jgi:hypothetical protein
MSRRDRCLLKYGAVADDAHSATSRSQPALVTGATIVKAATAQASGGTGRRELVSAVGFPTLWKHQDRAWLFVGVFLVLAGAADGVAVTFVVGWVPGVLFAIIMGFIGLALPSWQASWRPGPSDDHP